MSPKARRAPLDPDRVVDAALALLDEAGLDGLTVRGLAQRLGVQNPALYWHFRDKQEIVDRLAARVLAAASAAPRAGEPWDKWLGRAARAFRRALLAHRDGARVVASADLSGSAAGGQVAPAVARLTEAGFAPRDALIGVLAVFDYTLGATFEQQADPQRAGRGPLGSEATFEGGLQLLLDGLAARLPSRPATGSSRGRARERAGPG